MENDEIIEDLKEAEERLYAQVYHDNTIEMEIPTSNLSINSPTVNSNKPNIRYWQNSKLNTSTPKQQHQKFPPGKKRNFQKFQKDQEGKAEEKIDDTKSESIEAAKKFFVPYSSVLSFMAPSPPSDKITEIISIPSNYEKKNKPIKFPKEKKLDRLAQKQIVRTKITEKIIKADKVREKKAKKLQIDSIAIESSSEDEVILVPLKPPPVINLDSSEDEGTIKKKKRGASPSSSSMISDDFIVSGDRLRLTNPLSSFEQQSNDVNDRLMEVLNEKEKMKKIKNLTKVSSSSSNSARSSAERSITEKAPKEKVKSKKKSQVEEQEIVDTVYNKVKSKKKKSQSESSDEGEIVQKASKRKRRKSSGSRKKSTDEKQSEDEKDKDPKLELISNTLKAQKKKKAKESEPCENVVVVEQPKAIIEEVIMETEPKDDDIEIITQPPDPIYEITDDDDDPGEDSDDSMKNFKTDVECDLSLNVTENTSVPHELDFIPADYPRSLSNDLDCEVGWNDEMKFFYNECSYGRDFSLSAIQNAMPDHPKYWQINHADRVRQYTDKDNKIRCRNCNEFGHIAVRCQRPKKKIVCFMCGENNHRETRCPNAICLRCGKPNKLFSTMCSSCHSTSRMICPICKYKGHSIEQCPDKWRRYHSTTTTEHPDELDTSFTENPRVFCSICAKRGHFAENCTKFDKTIMGLITSNPLKIISNKPSYSKHFNSNALENHQVLQLMTFMDCYKFNFNLPQNCQLYAKFRELFKQNQFEMFIKLQAIQEAPKRRKHVKYNKSATIEEIKEDSLMLNVTIGENSCINQNESGDKSVGINLDDTNSNYSFSDFYVDRNSTRNDENQDQNAIVPAAPADFIPLQDINRMPSPERNTDAKIMLKKEHAALLMSTQGQNLVYDLGIRFNITSQFNWDSTGNSLVITGMVKNQELFHANIRSFLFKSDIEEITNRSIKSTQVPKVRHQLVNYLQTNLNSIRKTSVKDAKKNLLYLFGAQRDMDCKKVLKYRKTLNIIFMGYMKLRDGGFHVESLRKILQEQKREIENGKGENAIDQQLREEINNHIRYIFSAIDHGGYSQLFDDFQRLVRGKSDDRQVARRW